MEVVGKAGDYIHLLGVHLHSYVQVILVKLQSPGVHNHPHVLLEDLLRVYT